MNTRQKAKKYKRECERLKSIMSATKVQPCVSNQHPIVTLRAEQLVDLADGYSFVGNNGNIFDVEFGED